MKKTISKKTVEQTVTTNKKRPSIIGRFFRFVWRKKWWILLIGAAAVAIRMITTDPANKKAEYISLNITRGDLRQVVSATGEIRPVNTVNVGSQVSGTIDNSLQLGIVITFLNPCSSSFFFIVSVSAYMPSNARRCFSSLLWDLRNSGSHPPITE